MLGKNVESPNSRQLSVACNDFMHRVADNICRGVIAQPRGKKTIQQVRTGGKGALPGENKPRRVQNVPWGRVDAAQETAQFRCCIDHRGEKSRQRVQ